MPANEHYVSQVLLRRFTIDGHFQRYQVDTDRWNRRSPSNVFSHSGYNELRVEGQVDNTLEQEFSKVETDLPKSFQALDSAVTVPSTVFPDDVYSHICRYCAFLKNVSIFSKAVAPVDFVMQVNSELQNGNADTLRDVLEFPEEIIKQFQEEYARGKKVIIQSENFLQLVYRIRFRHWYPSDYKTFRFFTNWTIFESPVELPLSDVAIVPYSVSSLNVVVYVLPISPRLLLRGILKTGEQPSSPQTTVSGSTLTAERAGKWRDIICLSAIKELISPHKIDDIQEARARAKATGMLTHKIVNLREAMSAGTTDFTSKFGLVLVPVEEYVRFVHSFVQPPGR
jgi:hypothetical protein